MKDEHTLSRRLRHLDQMQRLKAHPIHAFRMIDVILVWVVLFFVGLILMKAFD